MTEFLGCFYLKTGLDERVLVPRIFLTLLSNGPFFCSDFKMKDYFVTPDVSGLEK